MNSPQATT